MKRKANSSAIDILVLMGIMTLIVFVILYFYDMIDRGWLDAKDIRFYTVTHKLLYSPNCFIAEDLGTSVPGIIDMENSIRSR